ncbi:MAG TPA: hypothetical protein VFK02_31325 [Kofleriaceae bacterium]|nr:hypothetical protein [Kofleriaceae bacterium]
MTQRMTQPVTGVAPTRALVALCGLAGLAGCPSSSPSEGNPRVLWLATDATETEVKLVESEPPPF